MDWGVEVEGLRLKAGRGGGCRLAPGFGVRGSGLGFESGVGGWISGFWLMFEVLGLVFSCLSMGLFPRRLTGRETGRSRLPSLR